MVIENRFFNSYNDVGVVALLLSFSLRRTGFYEFNTHPTTLLEKQTSTIPHDTPYVLIRTSILRTKPSLSSHRTLGFLFGVG